MSDTLHDLLQKYGDNMTTTAEKIGVSRSAVGRWVSGERPSLVNATRIARLFSREDGERLLREWGYDKAADGVKHWTATHDPNVANGWRLDTLIAEIRELRKELRQRPTLIETSTVQRGEVLVLRANFGEELIDHVMEAVAHTDLQGRVLILDGDIEMAVIDKEESDE